MKDQSGSSVDNEVESPSCCNNSDLRWWQLALGSVDEDKRGTLDQRSHIMALRLTPANCLFPGNIAIPVCLRVPDAAFMTWQSCINSRLWDYKAENIHSGSPHMKFSAPYSTEVQDIESAGLGDRHGLKRLITLVPHCLRDTETHRCSNPSYKMT